MLKSQCTTSESCACFCRGEKRTYEDMFMHPTAAMPKKDTNYCNGQL